MLARPPHEQETARVVALYEKSLVRFQGDLPSATKLAAEPLGPVPAGMNAAELAAWTTVGNVLLNLDETLMKRCSSKKTSPCTTAFTTSRSPRGGTCCKSRASVSARLRSAVLSRDGYAAPEISPLNPLAPRQPQFAAKAKRVIYLHLTGSPPHLDLYDYKPELVKRTGEECPQTYLEGKRFTFTSGVPKLLGTPQLQAAWRRRRVAFRRDSPFARRGEREMS